MTTETQPKERSFTDRLTSRTLWLNITFILIASVVLWFIWPELLHLIVFKWVILRWWFVIPMGILVYFAYQRWKVHSKGRSTYEAVNDLLDEGMSIEDTPSRTVIKSLAVFTAAIFFSVVMKMVIGYGTYHQYAQFADREAKVVTDPGSIRYTPRRIAFRGMNDAVNVAQEQVLADYSMPYVTPEGFGYVSPLVPDGVVNIFSFKNTGQMMFDDRADALAKVRRVEQRVEIGPGMEWFDALERHLVRTDFFATYDEPHLALLDPTKPDRLTSIVPKTKYHFWLFPYWAGVVLVHDTGEIEDIPADVVGKDERLAGQWLFPMGLARYYVTIQNNGSDMGPLGMYFQRPGNIAIVDLPDIEVDSENVAGEMSTNQFPFLLRGDDGKLYHQIPTKAEGGGLGLSNMFYVDATTGELSKFAYKSDGTIHHGPDAILSRVKNLPGWNWRREVGQSVSGNFEAVEPVQIIRPSEPHREYWKVTITTTSFTTVAATVVVPADDPEVENMLVFKAQRDFDTWSKGGTVELETASDLMMQIDELEHILTDVQARLAKLREATKAEQETATDFSE